MALPIIAALIAALILVALVAVSAYVRLAPTDVAAWHVPVAGTDPVQAGPCADKVTIVPKGARASCLVPDSPQSVLNKLEATALTSARTLRLAGSPETGRITWEARSFLMGYPDYITAEATPTAAGTRLDILSRQRFGDGDWGVNAARLKDWLSQL